MTEVTPWEAFKNGRGTRGVRKCWVEERSRGCKLTKAAAEQRAAGDNNHDNETVVSLLKYLCIKNSPSTDVHRRQSSFSAPALISESFHGLLWNTSLSQSKTWLSDNWAEKATIWYWEGRKSLATAKGLFWSRLAALGGPTTLRAWHKQPNHLLFGPFRKPVTCFIHSKRGVFQVLVESSAYLELAPESPTLGRRVRRTQSRPSEQQTAPNSMHRPAGRRSWPLPLSVQHNILGHTRFLIWCTCIIYIYIYTERSDQIWKPH